VKQRSVHELDGLMIARDGRWTQHARVPLGWVGTAVTGPDDLSIVEKILVACPWLRKNGRPMSEKSKTEYGNTVKQAYKQLGTLGFHLKKPWNLEQRHVEALCAFWSKQGLSASTVQGRLMVLSWWGALLGRPGLVRGTHDYQHAFGERCMQRRQSAERDISPRGVGMEREEVVRRAMALDATFGNLVLLEFALGLREKEALLARPWHDMIWGVDAPVNVKDVRSDTKSHWKLDHNRGSKGGRPRVVYLNQGEWQAQALLRVRDFVVERGRAAGLTLAQARRQSLGWSSCETLVRAKLGIGGVEPMQQTAAGRPRQRGVLTGLASDMKRYQNLCTRAGFTRAQLGFTGHSFRHHFAHRELEAAGFVARFAAGSVEGGWSGAEAAWMAEAAGLSLNELKDLVKKGVSEQLGHARVSVTAAYYGRVVMPRP
jgi:Integrase